MKQALAIIVILLAIITVIFLVVLSNQATSENQTTKRPDTQLTEGTVTSATSTSLTITNGKSQRVISIAPTTQITDASGGVYPVDQIQKNFTVKVKHSGSSPEKIIVLTQPNVIVYSPDKNSTVGQRFLINGVARVFENVVSIKVTRSNSDEILLETFATADAPDIGKYGGFTKEIDLRPITALKNGDKVILTVYQSSAKDGSEQDSVIIPLTLDFKRNLIVKAYFTNEMLNPTTECEIVFPVEREVAYTQATARAAIEELLKGPSDQEALKGYRTSLNPGVSINSLTISNGVAKIDFSQELQENVAGSCRVLSIRSQIKETLMQFPSVQSIEISINGNADTSLQP